MQQSKWCCSTLKTQKHKKREHCDAVALRHSEVNIPSARVHAAARWDPHLKALWCYCVATLSCFLTLKGLLLGPFWGSIWEIDKGEERSKKRDFRGFWCWDWLERDWNLEGESHRLDVRCSADNKMDRRITNFPSFPCLFPFESLYNMLNVCFIIMSG